MLQLQLWLLVRLVMPHTDIFATLMLLQTLHMFKACLHSGAVAPHTYGLQDSNTSAGISSNSKQSHSACDDSVTWLER